MSGFRDAERDTETVRQGKDLARSWIQWSTRLEEVVSVDLERLQIFIEDPSHTPSRIVMSVDPAIMPEAFQLLAREGFGFWSDVTDAFEAAWRMLSVDLVECLSSLEDGADRIQIKVGKIVDVLPAG